jgi:hypothetical protein
MRRAATRVIAGAVVRGLKPTATITMSRRDKEAVSHRGTPKFKVTDKKQRIQIT